MSKAAALAALSLVLVGCKSEPAPQASSPAVGGSAQPAASSAPKPAGPAVHAALTSKWLRVMAGGPTPLVLAGGAFVVLDAKGARQDPAFQRGIDDEEVMGGSFPDSAITVAVPPLQSGDSPTRPFSVLTWSKGAWTKTLGWEATGEVVGLIPYKDDHWFTLVTGEKDYRLQLVAGKPGIALPSPGQPPADAGDGGCKVPVIPQAATGHPGGLFAVLGPACGTEKPMVGVWPGGAKQGTFLPLEDMPAGGGKLGLEALSATELLVYLDAPAPKGFVRRVEGGKITPVDALAGKRVRSVLADGARVWVIADGALLERAADGTFKEVVPASAFPGAPVALAASGLALPWITVDVGPGKQTLMGALAVAKVRHVEPDINPRELYKKDGYYPATEACDQIFAVLQMNVSEGQRFPKIAKAIAGDASLAKLSFVVESYGELNVLGAEVPDLDTGTKLVAAVRAEGNAIARTICRKPTKPKPVKLGGE